MSAEWGAKWGRNGQPLLQDDELLRPDKCGLLTQHIAGARRSMGHVPLIDHNPRRGRKIELAPCEAQCFKERTGAERANSRLKDGFGGRHVRVRGNAKVMSHLMFGALTADQLLRLLT